MCILRESIFPFVAPSLFISPFWHLFSHCFCVKLDTRGPIHPYTIYLTDICFIYMIFLVDWSLESKHEINLQIWLDLWGNLPIEGKADCLMGIHISFGVFFDIFFLPFSNLPNLQKAMGKLQTFWMETTLCWFKADLRADTFSTRPVFSQIDIFIIYCLLER